jgi:hypothetical protein
MAKKLLLFLTMLGSGFFSQAQSLDIGLFGGGSYFITDLNPTIHFKDLKPAYGIVGRYYSGSRWAFRSSVTTTSSESLSRLTDFSVVAEFNFFDYFTGSTKSFVTPFIFGGISSFFYTSTDKIDKNPNLSIPFGLGIKYSINERLGMAFEWRMHKSIRDDLEKLGATEHNKYQKDWYNFTGVSLTYRLDLTNPGACNGFNKNEKY